MIDLYRAVRPPNTFSYKPQTRLNRTLGLASPQAGCDLQTSVARRAENRTHGQKHPIGKIRRIASGYGFRTHCRATKEGDRGCAPSRRVLYEIFASPTSIRRPRNLRHLRSGSLPKRPLINMDLNWGKLGQIFRVPIVDEKGYKWANLCCSHFEATGFGK